MSGKIVVVIQARMTSNRLPGKVLAPLPSHDESGLTVLDWVVNRCRLSKSADAVVVATSTDTEDDRIVDHCRIKGYEVFRGPLQDVLFRVLSAASAYGAETIVRVTADCPLVSPEVIDELLKSHFSTGADFTSNRLPPPSPRTWPVGLDVEIAKATAVQAANHEATSAAHREHVMPFIYSQPDRFRLNVMELPTDLGHIRWTLDTPEDLAALTALITRGGLEPSSSWKRALSTWEKDPTLRILNDGVEQNVLPLNGSEST